LKTPKTHPNKKVKYKNNAMLIGEFESKTGEKKRVAIPKKFREELGTDLVLTRGYEKCLVLVNKKMLENIAQDVVTGSFIDKNIRETSRFLVGSAIEVQPDKQGRVVIPTGLFEHAGLKNDVVFIGLVNWIEVWDKKEWESKLNYLSQNSEEIATALRNGVKESPRAGNAQGIN